MNKIEIQKDQACNICQKPLVQDGKVAENVIHEKKLGVVHSICVMPYVKEEELKIFFQLRCYSIGDTIAATPIIRELKRLHPRAKINVASFFPDLFKYNPHVNAMYDFNTPIQQAEIDTHHFIIDGFDEKKGSHFSMHSVEYSSICALNRSIHQSGWQYEVNYGQEDKDRALEVAKAHGINPDEDELILVHPHGTEWKTRDWGREHFQELNTKLQAAYPDHRIVSIGGKRSEVPAREMKNYVELEGVVDLYGKMTLLESMAFMDLPCVKLLITPDTGTLHIGATRPSLKIVGIFTLIRAFFRTPVRYGVFGHNFIGINAESGCNCTYNNRPLTNEMQFNSCPKLEFLERTRRIFIPEEMKRRGLEYLIPENDWSKGKLKDLIKEASKEYRGSLPCFPSADKVMVAVNHLMRENG